MTGISDPRYGGSAQVTTVGTTEQLNLIELSGREKDASGARVVLVQGAVPAQGKYVESEEVTVSADNGNDDTKTLLVGPNGSAHHRLKAGQGISWRKTDPALITISDGNKAGQIVYISWGGPTDRWLERERARLRPRQ